MSAVLVPAQVGRPYAEAAEAFERPREASFAGAAVRLSLDAPPSLDDVISHGWEGLRAGVAMACPVCDGELVPDAGGGSCERCGSTLA